MRRIKCTSNNSCLCRRVQPGVCPVSNAEAIPETPRSHASCRAIVKRVVTAWLRAHGHPLKTVAARLGVAESTVSQWANGQRFPRPDEMDALADCAGVAPVCLFCPDLADAYEARAREMSDGTM